MSDPFILFVKPKAISAKDKKVLQGAGVMVVEIDDPAAAKFVRAGVELEGGDILKAAAHAISNASLASGSAKELFADAVCKAIAALPSPPSVGR